MRKLKALLFLLLSLLCLSSKAATVTFSTTNFVAGLTTPRPCVISQVANTLPSDGTYIVIGQPLRLPYTNNGNYSVSLRYGCYMLDIDGFHFPKPLLFCVPNDNNTYPLTQLAGLQATNITLYIPKTNGYGTNTVLDQPTLLLPASLGTSAGTNWQ